MIILKNWSVGYKGTFNEKMFLHGKVYGHSSFNMGDLINTSSIQKFTDTKDFIMAETHSGSQYIIFKDDIDVEFLKNNPDFYNRMIEHAKIFQSKR